MQVSAGWFILDRVIGSVIIGSYAVCVVRFAAGPLGKLPCVSTSLEEKGEIIKRQFNSYLGRLFAAVTERREQDEMNILDSRW
jgi:hypothetical protein